MLITIGFPAPRGRFSRVKTHFSPVDSGIRGRADLAILSSTSLPISHEGDCLAAMDALASIIGQLVHGVDPLRDLAATRDICATPGAARPAGRCGDRLRCLRGTPLSDFAALAKNRDWLCGLVQQWWFVAAFLYIAVYAVLIALSVPGAAGHAAHRR